MHRNDQHKGQTTHTTLGNGLARVAENRTAENSRQERANVNVTKTEESAPEKSGVQAVGSTRQSHPGVHGSLSVCLLLRMETPLR